MSNDTQPEIRFPGFTEDWELCKLGEKVDISSASRVHKHEWSSSGVRFFRSSDIMSAYNGTTNQKAFIPNELYEELIKKSGKVNLDDILVTGGGSVGVPYLVSDEKPLYFKDADLLWIKNSGVIDGQFLYTFFISPFFRKYIKSISHIGTISHYTIVQAKETPIKLPSFKEQGSIGSFFKYLDDTITLHQRKLDLLKETKKGFLQKMFPKNGAKVPEVRFPGFTEDWEERKLSELAEVKTGFPFKNDDFIDGGNYLVITNGNIQNNSALVDGNIGNRISAVSDEIKDKYLLNYGDILVTMDGTVGRTAKVFEKNQILAQRVGRLVANTTPEFLYQWLNTGKFFGDMTKVSHGGTIKHISLSEISDFNAFVPVNEDERVKIGSLLLNIDKTITLHQRKLDLLKEMKKGFLQKMFV
ncbi:restriction endonuclease subunit S [Enterococcus faecium]|uniref:restriction endonuclease subunit S n=1 Tax=Enterococcus faecium TaxID=1352 RepID=UPI001E2A0330|nr:restriction endonuclease subunit S [Enterococcus faecium]MCD5099741.1 restriction endonuclease subunit S [Enterococcus faecium]